MNNKMKKLKWVLIVGILITLNLFFYFSINLFHKEPKFDQFCKTEQINIQPENKDDCVAKGGQWNGNYNYGKPIPASELKNIPSGYCDIHFSCSKEYQETREVYQRNIFVAFVVLGIISIILGFVFSAIEAVSLGLSLGGLLSLIIGSIRYWSAMDDYLRVIILGLALAMLILLGVKKFKD